MLDFRRFNSDAVYLQLVIRTLEKLDFLVVQELFETDTTAFADVVLPAASFAEVDGTFTNNDGLVQRVRQSIPPVHQAKPDWMITAALAAELGKDFGFEMSASAVFREIADRVPAYAGLRYPVLKDESNPVQAKYNPLKTWGRVTGEVEVRTQCVVSRLIHSGRGPISALEYIEYDDGQPPPKPQRVTADLFVLAGNAIENAKLLLASRVPNTSDQIGRNLMDHPYVLAWALMPYAVGAFRGPSSTSGI